MDFKQIQELIKLVNDSNLGEVTVEQKDFKITIRQKEEQITQIMASSMPSAPMYQQMPQAAPQASLPQASAPAPAASSAPQASATTITIKSPMIGSKSSPDKPNLTDVGEEVTPGKVVCIIEAMKLFNEIESEVKGRIVKVLVEDASPVEYDQPLFLVEPA
jgi:acetyl-CoA carboxylase biotin carboxyl carrier protein